MKIHKVSTKFIFIDFHFIFLSFKFSKIFVLVTLKNIWNFSNVSSVCFVQIKLISYHKNFHIKTKTSNLIIFFVGGSIFLALYEFFFLVLT